MSIASPMDVLFDVMSTAIWLLLVVVLVLVLLSPYMRLLIQSRISPGFYPVFLFEIVVTSHLPFCTILFSQVYQSFANALKCLFSITNSPAFTHCYPLIFVFLAL